jgi:hypothetical protein
MADIAAADDLVDEAAVGGQIVEIARSPHQQRVIDRPLEMAVRAFDGPILMGDAGIVAGRLQAVVAMSVVRTFGAIGCLNLRSVDHFGWSVLCGEFAALRV